MCPVSGRLRRGIYTGGHRRRRSDGGSGSPGVAARRYRESAGIPGSARSERGAAAETPSGDL